MVMYIGEEVVWKCRKHPSKRHRHGICPVCLRDRLVVLCPDCANMRPCSCYAASSSSSSSSTSSSSSFSFFSTLSSSRDGGSRVSDLIDREPTFRRSRSVAIPYVFSRFAGNTDRQTEPPLRRPKSKITWFLSKFTVKSTRKEAEVEKNDGLSSEISAKNKIDKYVCSRMSCASADDFARTILMKSRSVNMAMTTSGDEKSPVLVEKGWSFPTPMMIFRQSSKATTSSWV